MVFFCGVDFASAAVNPWYSIKNIDKLEISIYFDESSLNIKEVYHFHLGLFTEVLKANPELGLIIAHGGQTSFSQVRSRHLYSYLTSREGVPRERVFVRSDLVSKFEKKKGEYLLVYLEKVEAKPAPPPPPPKLKPKPIVLEPPKKLEIQEVEAEVVDESEMDYAKPGKTWDWYLGLGYRDYSFVGRSKFSSYVLDLQVEYELTETMQFKLDLQGVYPEVNGDINPEYSVKLGFDTMLDRMTLNSRLYQKSNFIWSSGLSEFDTVTDIGLSQRIGFRVLDLRGNRLSLGFLGEISFSNNFSKIESANVYGYTTDIQFVFRKFNMRTSVYFTQREYRTTGGVFDVSIFGISVFYGF